MVVRGINTKTPFPIPLTTIALTLDFSRIMGPLKHTSEKATPYRTDEMQVKKGVFDREKTLVKTR
jgi:hypothetical protein